MPLGETFRGGNIGGDLGCFNGSFWGSWGRHCALMSAGALCGLLLQELVLRLYFQFLFDRKKEVVDSQQGGRGPTAAQFFWKTSSNFATVMCCWF